MEKEQYDVLIAGAGPGGLTCAMYATRGGLSVGILDRGMPGGQMANTELIENYPGFPEPITGPDLAELMMKQATKFGTEIGYGNIIEVGDRDDESCTFPIKLDSGEIVRARMFVVATGAQPKILGLPGEIRLNGKGVSYCAVCDGRLVKGIGIKEVCVIGGGDAAVEEAVYLSKLFDKVTIIHRRLEFRASQIAQDTARRQPNIEFALNSQIEDVLGDEKVSGVLVRDVETGEKREIPCGGVFFYVGIIPQSDFVKDKLQLDEQGFIVTNEHMETSVCGIYAIGDVRRPSYRQITSAVGDGTAAALHIDMAIHRKPERFQDTDGNGGDHICNCTGK